jgi:hypothetical protein
VIGGRASECIGAAGGDQHQAGDLDQGRLDIDTNAFGYVIVFGAARKISERQDDDRGPLGWLEI